MDKFTNQSLKDMLNILEDLDPKKFPVVERKIQILKEKLDVQADSGNEKRDASSKNDK